MGINKETLDILRKNNIKAGFTTIPRKADLNNDPLLELPRMDTNDFPQ